MPSIPLWIDVPVAVFGVLLFGAIGIAGFMKRAID
jgi:ABC-2 type transport system permease protein